MKLMGLPLKIALKSGLTNDGCNIGLVLTFFGRDGVGHGK
jgi:hypothetical protein